MIHEEQAGGIAAFWIDHFRPRSKGGPVNDYANLYWACMLCNHIKGESWPAPSESLQTELAIAIPFIPAPAAPEETGWET
jgi:HNH endonuclease